MKCVSMAEFVNNRLTYKAFVSPVFTATVFPYVLSDTVKPGKWRVVIGVSVIDANKGGTTTRSFGLWLLPPGQLPTKLDGTDPFFLDYQANIPPTSNQPPPAFGIRMDNSGNVAGNSTVFGGSEQPSMPNYGAIYMPSGWTLMGLMLPNQTAAANPTQAELRILYGEFLTTEDFRL